MATTTSCNSHPRVAKLLLWLTLCVASATAGAASPQFNYLLWCSGCHIEDGSGMAGVVPDLKLDMGFFAGTPEGRSYLVRVPGSAHSPLSDEELAGVLNWMLSTFAADDEPQLYTVDEVTANRRIPMLDPPGVRHELLKGRNAPEVSDNARQLESFGAALFFDTSLSRFQNQACASCHDPVRAFSDARAASIAAGASIGSDGVSVGLRNAPALTYLASAPAFSLSDTKAALSRVSPAFERTSAGLRPADAVRGGFFWDGRAATLEDQVLKPFVDPREMDLPDLDELAQRVLQRADYRAFLGETRDHQWVLSQVASALAAFLRSDTLNSFDSRYDRYVRGELTPTRQELIGMGLFFAPGFTSCANCHQSEQTAYSPREVFTNYRYENIGTPVNRQLLARNQMGDLYRDAALADNPDASVAIDRAELAGRIKVPGLRNVAVTGPYMHNGVFSDLSTLLVFYNHFNETGNSGLINPETTEPWVPPAFPEGVVTDKLQSGFPLSGPQLAALTAFLRMLTDQRYEHLL